MAKAPLDGGVGKRIRRFRRQKGMTQADLARAAGVSPAYLSELEAGLGRRPSGRILLSIAEALGVTVADLLGRPLRPPRAGALPKGLAEFARDAHLPDGDVEMLASIRWRGDPPRTAKRWEVILDSIRSSKVFDDEH
jgi:transcriptional regulator with XRE-family HTH domain